MTVTVGDLRTILDRAYPPALAAGWDTGIGLTGGDPAAPVRHVLLAVDVDPATVEEAVQVGAQLLLTHHPLLFRPVQSVAADTAKGALLHRMITAGVAHLAAHTNADKAVGGVNDALAAALGVSGARPLEPDPVPGTDKIVVFVPVAGAQDMVAALAAAGAGTIGDYAEAAFVSAGTGQFLPLDGARPAIGAVGRREYVEESRVEMILPRTARAAVVAALRAAHPYEEPAFDLVELVPDRPARTGSGRVGVLAEPLPLADFADRVAAALPATAGGVRFAGDPARTVRTVAVCGGAGQDLMDAAASAGADVFVTSDTSHHRVAEFVALPGAPAVIDVAHWSGEWPWLQRAAAVIDEATGGTVGTTVSTLRTDPWVGHA
ncbi:Nif3-like dinuclear metal center hexameric protein [Nakamurella sp. YIM 132087]|uniref:GTP cyclohydrolase 1 type 2 homolog n=1 Tax=Nakamurella alba TaxID=2665158 RepID=A0A7K1FTA0_9ACTN|nr:Nif3-like dinuclear metal center hexameric protein [Nakamurella alba]MTD17320.1 Nif3-like dinuclear metal center hexameric protein [Nakamurella alba]